MGFNPNHEFWKDFRENLPAYKPEGKSKKEIFDSHMSICWAMTMDPSLPFLIRDSEYGGFGIFPTCKSFGVLKPFLIGFCLPITKACYIALTGDHIGFGSIIECNDSYNILYGPISFVNHECKNAFKFLTDPVLQSLPFMQDSGLVINTAVCGVTSYNDGNVTVLDPPRTSDDIEFQNGQEFFVCYDHKSERTPKISSRSSDSFICRCNVCREVGQKKGLLDKSLLPTALFVAKRMTTTTTDLDKCAVTSCTRPPVCRDPYIQPRNLSCRCLHHLYLQQSEVLHLNKTVKTQESPLEQDSSSKVRAAIAENLTPSSDLKLDSEELESSLHVGLAENRAIEKPNAESKVPSLDSHVKRKRISNPFFKYSRIARNRYKKLNPSWFDKY